MIFVRPAPGDLFYPVYLREVPFARGEVSAVYRTGERGEVFLRALRPELQAADAALANAWLRRIRQEHGIAVNCAHFLGKLAGRYIDSRSSVIRFLFSQQGGFP
jgi:hypothetical protein